MSDDNKIGRELTKESSQGELLDHDKILLTIAPENTTLLSRLEIFDCIDSTNDYLLQHAKRQAKSGWVCFAEEQTEGRGRQGRVWFSPAGANIYCSLLWEFAIADISNLSLAVAVMIVRALQKYGVREGVRLKWPNDVLFAERKLAGILLERAKAFVVIGIGLNVDLSQNRDISLSQSAIDLSEIMGEKVKRNLLAGLIVNELLTGLPRYAEKGLSVFFDEWCNYDALIHQEITVHTLEKTVIGKMCGINSAGELLLRSEQNHVQSFRCGEVTVRKVK